MRKKILHFFPDNQEWGGIEVYLQSTLSGLSEQGNYRIVAAVTENGKLSRTLKSAGIPVYELPVHIHTPILRTLDFRVLGSLMSVLKSEKPDLVHIHKGRIEQAVIRLAGFPMVYTYHSYGGPNNLENTRNKYIRTLYSCTTPLLRALTPFLSGMMVVSDYERRRLYRETFLPGGFHAEVLHNGIPTKSMLNKVQSLERSLFRKQLGTPRNARIISFVCRLAPDKNVLAFLRIARRVLRDTRLKYPVHFLVAGDGPLSQEFKQAFVSDDILSGHGCYLGFRNDVHQIMKASHLTVSTSLQEGFGLRVLESLLFGRPCITYAAGGIPEVMSLPQAINWLVPVDNEDLFVERLIEAINMTDEDLKHLEPILEEHARGFDIDHHVQALESFYEQTFLRLAIRN